MRAQRGRRWWPSAVIGLACLTVLAVGATAADAYLSVRPATGRGEVTVDVVRPRPGPPDRPPGNPPRPVDRQVAGGPKAGAAPGAPSPSPSTPGNSNSSPPAADDGLPAAEPTKDATDQAVAEDHPPTQPVAPEGDMPGVGGGGQEDSGSGGRPGGSGSGSDGPASTR
jgi:hypothetical protein